MPELLGVPSDTDEGTHRQMIELIRALSPAERLLRAFHLTHSLRQLVIADVWARFPQATPREFRIELAKRLYGADELKTFPRSFFEEEDSGD